MIRTLVAAATLTVFIAAPAFAVEKPIDFVNKAKQGDMMEVQMAKVVLKKSRNPDVRAFAEKMLQDHTKSGKDLDTVARQAGIRAPKALDKDHRKKVTDMAKKGDSLDKDYVDFMSGDHGDDVAEYTDFSVNGQEPHLKAFAVKTLPTLEQHKDMIDHIKAKM